MAVNLELSDPQHITHLISQTPILISIYTCMCCKSVLIIIIIIITVGSKEVLVRFVDSLRTRIVTVCVVRKLYRMRRHDIFGIQRQGVCERRSKNVNMVMKSNN